MYPFDTPNAHSDQHNGNGNVAGPQANYNFDSSGSHSFVMQNGNSNADRDVPNSPQQLLFQAYQQLHQAVVGRQQLITSYHDLVIKHETQVSALNVKHEAQVLALKDHIDMLKGQIDTLKDELRTAQADTETSRLSSTRYIISYLNAKRLLMFYAGLHNCKLEWHQQLLPLRPVIHYQIWTPIFLKDLNSQLTDPRSTPKKYFGHSPTPRPTALFFRGTTPMYPAHQWKKHFVTKTAA